MKNKKIIWILLPVFVSVLLLAGCSLKGMKESRSANGVFDRFTDTLFQNELAGNTINLHYTLADPEKFGITDYPVTLGSYSLESMEESMAAVNGYLEQMEAMSYHALSDDRQLTYDCIYTKLKTEQQAAGVLPYTEILSAVTGFQAQLPVLLAEYAFYDKKDVEDYLSLLEQVRPYFHQVLLFEQDKAANGLFMPDYAADDIIAQCQGLIADPGDHFLVSTFSKRLKDLDLSPEETARYTEQNQKALDTCFFPAYADLIQGLEELKGRGQNPYGLCYFPQGRAYYAYLTAANTGSGFSVEELNARILESLNGTFSDFVRALEKVRQNSNTKAPAASGSVRADPRACLEDLREKIKKDFPPLFQVSYTINNVDKCLEDYLSPAFYLTPALDHVDSNVIYLNRAHDYTPLSLYTTLAHEGFPGHLYQNMYTRSLNQNKVRALFGTTGYGEGWATYGEMLSYSYADTDPDLAELYRQSSLLSLGLSAALDIGIHYNYWTPDDAAAFLEGYGFTDSGAADHLYRYIVEEPANYLNYYVGYLEFLRLKELAQTALSDRFDLKDFHEMILNIGEAPFPVVEKYLKKQL